KEAEQLAAGVVDEDVDALPAAGFRHRLAALGGADIGTHGQVLAPGGKPVAPAEGLALVLDAGPVGAHQDPPRPRPGVAAAAGRADAAAGAGADDGVVATLHGGSAEAASGARCVMARKLLP